MPNSLIVSWTKEKVSSGRLHTPQHTLFTKTSPAFWSSEEAAVIFSLLHLGGSEQRRNIRTVPLWESSSQRFRINRLVDQQKMSL